MRKIIVLIIVLIVNVLANDVKFYNPSFDCSKVKKESIEYKICTNEKLSKLDTNLSKVYNSFHFISKEIKGNQIEWIEQRNQCKDDQCIQTAYQKRIKELTVASANQNTFPKEALEFFKQADQDMEQTFLFKDDEKQNQKEIYQKEKFFRFQDIHYQEPIVKDVKYDKLKELLGDCYQFKLNVFLSKRCRGAKCSSFYVDEEYQKGRDFYFTVWNAVVKGRKQLFVIRRDKNNQPYVIAYLLDKKQCSQVVKELDFYYPNAIYNRKIEWKEIIGDAYYGTIYKGEFFLLKISHYKSFLSGRNSLSLSLFPMYYKDKSFLSSATTVLTFKNNNKKGTIK